MNEQSVARVQAPSARAIRMDTLRYVALWLGGMFLKPEAYVYQRDRKNPFAHGLLYIAILGVLVGLAMVLGGGLRYATAPNADAVKNTIQVHLQGMPFYTNGTPQDQNNFDRQFDQFWNQFSPALLGYPTNTTSWVNLVASIFTTPLGWVIVWLIYGALVHLVARGWNPETSYSELLGPLALATSPRLLHVIDLFPGTSISGLAIFFWVLICNVFAIRAAYKTTTRRAIWGALFPVVLLVVLLIVFAVLVGLVVGVATRRGG